MKIDTIFQPGMASATEWLQATQLLQESKDLLNDVPEAEKKDKAAVESVIAGLPEHIEYHAMLAVTGKQHRDVKPLFVH